MVGYRGYTAVDVGVRYPFGHGLSYTTFGTDELSVTPTGDDSVTVSVRITNTGERRGKHVVQVYVATGAGPVQRPVRELRAFAKVALEPGATTTVTLSLDRRAFAYYDIHYADWVIAGGDYRIQVGQNASDIVAEHIVTLPGDQLVPKLTLDSPFEEWLAHPSLREPVLELIVSGLAQGQSGVSSALLDDPDVLKMVGSMPIRQLAMFPGVELPLEKLSSLLKQFA
jgi:beta-glucosidase